jgi:GTPase Era involved in 16S rRNA processing
LEENYTVKDKSPIFAVLGHPNEGKSSVVSTLAEDDSVKISPTPGETRTCREYPVIIDGHTVIRFIDTPGFQNPRKTLEWIEKYSGPDHRMISEFIKTHRGNDNFADECELMSPLAEGAGIIFVVDGARPFRQIDSIEMEILRKTGLPRMIVINSKERGAAENIKIWKSEARKHFNNIRLFDAHKASFAQRIDLLESLKHIDPDWQPALEDTIYAFKADWQQRLEETASIIDQLLQTVIGHKAEKICRDESEIEIIRDQLSQTYQNQIAEFEKQAHQGIKKRFKHNIFSYELPPHSILKNDLFNKKTWQFLGLTRRQITLAGGGIGAGIGFQIDLVLGGIGLGMFTALGTLLGAGSAAVGTKKIASTKIKGFPLGGAKIQVGPVENDQLLYVLTDRSLIYFSHIINWAHSRRDIPEAGAFGDIDITPHLTANWVEINRRIIRDFFTTSRKGDSNLIKKASAEFRKMMVSILKEISGFHTVL